MTKRSSPADMRTVKTMARKIDFLIIGTPKSGTTALNDYLSQHPDIYLPKRKDDGMFITCLPEEQSEAFWLWYRDIRHETIIGGAEVNLMYFPFTAARVYHYNPQIRLIAILRNPIERAYSAYWYYLRLGWETSATFEEALGREPERRLGSLHDSAALTYLEHGCYYEQLLRYLDYFPHSHVCIILSEDLKYAAQQTLGKIMTWLGVDHERETIDLSLRSNESGAPRSRKLSQIIGSHNIWYRGMARKLTSRRFRQAVSDILIQLNTKPFEYPHMRPETRTKLAAYFAPHNEKLSNLIERDLSHWK
jgi:hypothetical protein